MKPSPCYLTYVNSVGEIVDVKILTLITSVSIAPQPWSYFIELYKKVEFTDANFTEQIMFEECNTETS